MIIKTHYFFHFKVRPWPFLISLNLFRVFLCLLNFIKWGLFSNLITTFLVVILNIFLWWVNYRRELNLEGIRRSFLEDRIKFGIILFISSEVFFFFSFFWSYFHYFLGPTLETRISWPPIHLQMFDFLGIPLVNTITLLISGVTVTISHYYFFKNNIRKSMVFLFFTSILGTFFTVLQLKEYSSAFFRINDSTFGSNFFILTGFHGLHVLIGTIFLIRVLFRRNIINANRRRITSFELSSWYWHFVDVVWIFLYFIIYYLNTA